MDDIFESSQFSFKDKTIDHYNQINISKLVWKFIDNQLPNTSLKYKITLQDYRVMIRMLNIGQISQISQLCWFPDQYNIIPINWTLFKFITIPNRKGISPAWFNILQHIVNI